VLPFASAAMTLLDVVFIVIGYLTGSLPMGVLVARLTGARDPRTVGSGRTGGTNALRAMGAWRAGLVATLDVLKGFVPVAAASLLGASTLGVALTGVAAVIGAARSIFLHFHGGRGVATGIGATIWMAPLTVPLAIPFFFGPIILTRFVSLGSLIGTLGGTLIIGAFVVLAISPWPYFLFALLGTAVIWIAHHDNIQRLLRGEERRFEPTARGDT
jgi:glycerol-3-phosphate acyltransferase PlsY